MNGYFIAIMAILIAEFALDYVVETLNVRHISAELPDEFDGYYDAQKYQKSQEYLKTVTRFHLLKSTFNFILIILFIILGGFNLIDSFARGFGGGEILTGLIFAGTLMALSHLIGIPFAAYGTFGIEQKYGFNKTTVRTFVLDRAKGFIVSAVVGGVIFATIIWFFAAAGDLAWVYCWIGVTCYQLFLTFIAPIVIMPLFNKFVPLEAGELKDAIEAFAREQDFYMKGIYKIDGSRRSTKANAFFTGFGKSRRIALFDTLIDNHTTGELVAVLAHEIGHYKKRHIFQSMALSIATSGLMFFLLGFFIQNPGLFEAFKMDSVSIYGSLIFFGFLYSPISLVFSVFSKILSRKNEYEADQFAIEKYGRPEEMIQALKKLTVNNLGNLTPHPVKVFMDHSHPTVLDRIKRIRRLTQKI